jgi:hypothetical protein
LQKQLETKIANAQPFGAGIKYGAVANSMPNQNRKLFLQTISGSVGEVKRADWIIPHLVTDAYIDNTGEYKHRYRCPEPPIYASEKAFFEAFLSDMQRKNVPVVVVGMPSQLVNRALLPPTFWSSFKAYLHSTCNNYGATFCDLSDNGQFVKHDYLDTVHLNAYGGNKLFAAIAAQIADNPKLASQFRLQAASGGRAPGTNNIGATAAVGSWR